MRLHSKFQDNSGYISKIPISNKQTNKLGSYLEVGFNVYQLTIISEYTKYILPLLIANILLNKTKTNNRVSSHVKQL